jgi:hypothetical protein
MVAGAATDAERSIPASTHSGSRIRGMVSEGFGSESAELPDTFLFVIFM